MIWGFHFGIFVLLLGTVQATKSSDPECEDLDALQRKATTAIEKVPKADAHVKCHTNKNCTGLICNGRIKGKDFRGTAILEGCNEPIRMLVHVNGKHILVKDGYERKIIKKPLPVYIKVNMKKRNYNVVSVTLKMKVCLPALLPKDFCGEYMPLVKEEKIRTHCNDSGTTMYPPLLPKPTRKGAEYSKNPECEGLKKMNDQLQLHYGYIKHLYPVSKFKCKPGNNCSDLLCSGVADNEPFNATVTIDYCHHPVKLWLKIDSEKKSHVNHGFKDGDTYPIVGQLVKIKVHMKRVRNVILLSMSIPTLIKDIYLVRNTSITVDPSHCPGYQANINAKISTNKSHTNINAKISTNKSHNKSLSSGAIAGVVIAAVVLFVLLIAIIVWIVRGKRQVTTRYNGMIDDGDPLVFDSKPLA